ncbi:hypothetical protein ACHWQZ_G014031 [Mnemiopsis leidyi]
MKDLDISLNSERDLTIPALNLEQNFTTTTPGDYPDIYKNQLQQSIDNTPSDTITCYTDGSKTDEGCGAGYIITTDNNNTIIHEESHRLPNCCTVFQAELSAITEACNHLTTHTNKHIIIWTDSLSSIQALTTLNNNSRTVANCLNSLNHLGANNNLELRWIAAHTGLWGNEKADELAKLGTTSNLILKRPVPQSHINNYSKPSIHRASWGKGLRPGKTINNINSTLINNRKDYRTAVQLITGHCGLNKHLFNMKKADTMECPLCGHREETVSHLLDQCPATTQLRGHYFNEYYLSINDISITYILQPL